MAIATATSLDVHMGGALLFADVSFKLEPRERMTLSGRNGAGKSTLLRMLAGELAPDAGSLVLQKGARVALHDQRPPREAAVSLGEYVFSGRTDMLETEAELEQQARSAGAGDGHRDGFDECEQYAYRLGQVTGRGQRRNANDDRHDDLLAPYPSRVRGAHAGCDGSMPVT